MTAYGAPRPARAAILEWVDAHRADVVGMAQSLVRIPSENKQPHGTEKACQTFVADYLRDLGCRVDIFTPLEVAGLTEHPAYWPGRDYTDRPNVVGVLSSRPGGPVGKDAGRRSLLFTGHIDVVPTVGQGHYGWWDGTVADGKLYGRGANDMKGGIAAYLMAARCIRELGLDLQGDLILETVVDEEFGGAHGTLACRLAATTPTSPSCPSRTTCWSAPPTAADSSSGSSPAPRGWAWASARRSSATRSLPSATCWPRSTATTRSARRASEPGFENDVFPLMPFVLRAGDLLPWGTGEAIPETAWVEFWIEIPPGVTVEQLKSELQAVVAARPPRRRPCSGSRPLGRADPLPRRQQHARRIPPWRC